MNLVFVQWEFPWPGPMCSLEAIVWFEARMRAESKHVRRGKRLVYAWDDGRHRGMWYEARRGRPERALRAECERRFGRVPKEVTV